MQNFVFSLQAAQLESAQISDITRVLIRFQNDINAQFFNNLSKTDLYSVFQEVWKFLLFTASHKSSSVRLLSYRSTGYFLLKLTPYFNLLVQKTFSDLSMVATIDIKSSAIIASAFAFISNRISLPYLDAFLDNTPVFHHFTISDPIFSEHLSAIITNLGELGNDWFLTLLHSFLSIYENSSDRYLMKSIASVIKHNPSLLMNDYLQYIKENGSYKKHLGLVSFIISSNHIDNNSLDFFDLAKASMEIIQHSENYSPTEIDSAFQILSTKTPSFYLQVDAAGSETLNISLSKQKPDQTVDLIDFGFEDNNNESKNSDHISIVVNASTFKDRPTIYLLDLPLNFAEPTLDDGSLTMGYKFKSLASRIKMNSEKTPIVLDIFLKYYKKEFDNNVSAVLQGIAECIQVLIKHSNHEILIPLLESAIFTPSKNWFHSADILSIIKNMNLSDFEKLFGLDGFDRILSLLLEFSLSPNEQVLSQSNKVLRQFINNSNFVHITLFIASKIDLFEESSIIHILPLLTDILSDFPHEQYNHLRYLAIQLIELTSFFSTNLNVLASIFHFLGKFNITFVPKNTLKPAFMIAISIIASSITCVSGFSSWEAQFSPEQLHMISTTTEMIQNDLNSKNIDVNSEIALSHEMFLSPCFAALKFILGIYTKMIKKPFILILYRKLRNIFALETALLVEKFWPQFTDDEKIQVLNKMYKSLKFIQPYDTATIIASLFIQIYKPEYAKKLENCKKELLKISNYLDKNPRCSTHKQLTIFNAISFITSSDLQSQRIIPSLDFESNIIDYYPDLYPYIFNSKIPNKTLNDIEITLDFETKKFTFLFPPNDLSARLEPNNPFIKTQIKKLTRLFTPDELKSYLLYYAHQNDLTGIKLVLQYCLTNKIFFSLIGINFPEKSLPIVIRFLKASQSTELDLFISSLNDNISLPFSIQIAVTQINQLNFLQSIAQSNKLSKFQLKKFAAVIPFCNFNNQVENDLEKTVIHCIDICHSHQKVKYILIILQNSIDTLKEISNNFISVIFKFINDHKADLNNFTVSQILFLLSNKNSLQQNKENKENLLKHINDFLNLSTPTSPELYPLYFSLDLLNNGEDGIYLKNILKLCDNLLKTPYPSVFITGIQLFSHAQKRLDGDKTSALFKQCLPKIIQKLSKRFKLFPIPESSTLPLANALTSKTLKKHQISALLLGINNIIPKSSDAGFSSYYIVLSHALAIVEENNKFKDESLILQAKMNELLYENQIILSSFVIKTYLKLVVSRAEKMSSKAKQENYVMNSITNFMSNVQEYSDCYDIANIIFEICFTISKFNGFLQLLPIMSNQIFKNAPRFFPVFVGVATFFHKYKFVMNQPEIISKANSSFIGCGKQMMYVNRAHGTALQLLADPTKMKIALDLASFAQDCEESDKIIQSLNV